MQGLTQQFGQMSLGSGVRWPNQQHGNPQPIASYQPAPEGYRGYYAQAQPIFDYQHQQWLQQQGQRRQRKNRRGGKRGTRRGTRRATRKQRKTRRN
jgi:hypothetical protein